MFDSIKKRIPTPSRQTISTAVGFVGGLYVARNYIRDRLDEVKVKLEGEKNARENLQRRFAQTSSNTSYTILALLPTLSSQILTEMDIDTLTRELQARSSRVTRGIGADSNPMGVNARGTATFDSHVHPQMASSSYPQHPYTAQPHLHLNPQNQAQQVLSGMPTSPSISSSIDIIEHDTRSDVGSASGSHITVDSTIDQAHGKLDGPPSPFSLASTSGVQSWVDSSSRSTSKFSSNGIGSSALIDASALSLVSASSLEENGREQKRAEQDIHGDSMMMSRASMDAVSNARDIDQELAIGSGIDNGLSASIISQGTDATTNTNTTATTTTTSDLSQPDPDRRTKAELWNEVKMLTLTRTLTTIYSLTLLCLLTTLQLTILARTRYVISVVNQEKEEKIKEQMMENLSLSNLMMNGIGLGGGGGLEKMMEKMERGEFDEEEEEDQEDDTEERRRRDKVREEDISEETESKYLTLSWWLLHVGWKDVGERVRRGVEEVFDGVSLKTKLSASDLHRLIYDVRRRVEHEVTFEGTERRTNFLSSLLPSTRETIQHVLTQGGFSSSFNLSPYTFDPDLGVLRSRQHLSTKALSSHTHQGMDESTTLSSSQLSNSQYFGVSHLQRGLVIEGGWPGHKRHDSDASHDSNPPQSLASSNSALVPQSHERMRIQHDAPFLALIDETRSIITSTNFAKVLEACLDRATEVLMKGLENNVFVDSSASASSNTGRRLASVLPGLARWSQLALDGLPNELVDNLLDVREMPCLSAIVFAKFEERFQ